MLGIEVGFKTPNIVQNSGVQYIRRCEGEGDPDHELIAHKLPSVFSTHILEAGRDHSPRTKAIPD